jgi:hypothetical protein
LASFLFHQDPRQDLAEWPTPGKSAAADGAKTSAAVVNPAHAILFIFWFHFCDSERIDGGVAADEHAMPHHTHR